MSFRKFELKIKILLIFSIANETHEKYVGRQKINKKELRSMAGNRLLRLTTCGHQVDKRQESQGFPLQHHKQRGCYF